MGSILQLASLCALFLAQNSTQDFLEPHNTARKEVGVGPLIWNLTLEAYARNYANERSKECALIHSNGPYGESLFWGFGEGFTDTAAAVKLWVDEKEDYDYNINTCVTGKECLHYTQIIWRNSERLGCARAACSDLGVFIMCNYDPPGNIIGERPY